MKVKRILFRKDGRMDVFLVKVSARLGDDLWILTNTINCVTPYPTSFEKAIGYLTEANGWSLIIEELEDEFISFDMVAEYQNLNPLPSRSQEEDRLLHKVM